MSQQPPEQPPDREPLFLYEHGQQVRWAEDPTVRWRILWRRYTEPDIMPGYVQYRLEPVEAEAALAVGAGTWAYEPDLVPWPETP